MILLWACHIQSDESLFTQVDFTIMPTSGSHVTLHCNNMKIESHAFKLIALSNVKSYNIFALDYVTSG